MAFKEAQQSNQGGYDTITWNKDKKVGEVITGTYIEKRVNVQGKSGSNLFVIENEEGKFAVWSSKVLEDYFANIETGAVVRITYLGKEKAKSGRDFNNYKVEVDDGTGDEGDPNKTKKGAKEDKEKLPFD